MKSPSHQMKRAGLAASLCFGLVLGMSAQLDAGRTNKTKIIDALAIMPAKDSVVYKQTMRDLLSTGNAGLAELIEMRKSAKGEMLVKLDYMLNSLADYAGDQKNPALADLLQQVYMQAVKDAPTAETAAFYFKQLKTVGTNRAVTFLQTYLSNPQLSEFAAQTLSAIGTGEAADALKTELPGVQASLKKHLINALGEMQAAETEELLLSQKSALSADDLSVLYFALSNSGSYKALTELQSAASAVNYAYDKNGATDAYLQLVERLGKSGDRKLVQKTTKNLLKVGEKTGNTALRCAAFTVLAETDSLKCTEMIIDALDDDNRMYRNTAFYYINQSDRAKVIPALCKKLPKASEEIQSDLLSWCGKYQIKEALPAIVGLMRSENNEIAVAAIQAAALIGGETAVEALSGLMVNGNAVQISRAKEVLGYTKGDVGNALMAKLKHATPEGKAAILTMVASQKDTSYAAQFISLCNDADPLIRKTAVTNLDKVVTATHLPELFKMLRGGNAQEIKSFQKAVMAAVASMPVADRFTAIQKQMQQESADKQGRYYLLMTAAPVQSSLDLIEAGCKTSDLNLKKDAIEALCSWNGPEVLDPLYSLCSNPQEASYFDQTWNAYVSKVADAGFTNEKKLIFLRKALDLAKNKEHLPGLVYCR
ncbi:MAG: HEAT repeat domain-containing protein [Bacteroidales bacterium]